MLKCLVQLCLGCRELLPELEPPEPPHNNGSLESGAPGVAEDFVEACMLNSRGIRSSHCHSTPSGPMCVDVGMKPINSAAFQLRYLRTEEPLSLTASSATSMDNPDCSNAAQFKPPPSTWQSSSWPPQSAPSRRRWRSRLGAPSLPRPTWQSWAPALPRPSREPWGRRQPWRRPSGGGRVSP